MCAFHSIFIPMLAVDSEVFGVLVALFVAASQIISALAKKKQPQKKPVMVPRQAPSPLRRAQPAPAMPRKIRKPIVFPSLRPIPPAAPIRIPAAPSMFATTPAPPPAGLQAITVAASRPALPSKASSIRGWLTPQTLRSQFILTEIFQPPVGLRKDGPA